MKVETTESEVQQRILKVLRGCPTGQMEKDSLRAACLLDAEIEGLQAALALLQRGEILGSVGADGEVTLHPKV